ncbi:hypothetical protein BUALT_Bualt15G0133800 [Buddleja alternifolia]|uniref:Late embryogenesis abundant protein n=1 Tax=Buddleja alternifolia TaxID=168488 RepID=A0AAV6WF81_9LAMI|nr:hypothetical protein BUALT_Bualt15G0133800 [Buddleja alternifolia]
MHPRSSIFLCKFLSRHPFGRYPTPKSPFFSRSLSHFSNQFSSHPKTHHFYNPSTITPPTHSNISQHLRNYSVDTDKEVDKINLKFAEAREEIESAMDSKETVYFNEEAECARAAVGEVLEMYEGLLDKLPESEKAKIQRAMGLKIEQLKAELQQLNE